MSVANDFEARFATSNLRVAKGCGLLGLGFALGLMLCPQISFATDIKAGTATVVNKRVMGIIHGNEQLLSTGSEVFMDQVVRTDDDSSTQLQLLDRTGISIGSRSEVVLDRFVFDPDRPKGDVVLYATKGVFRFVTGTQDSSSYTIKTPMATIGVRGTIIEFNSTPDIFELLLVKGKAKALIDASQATVSLDSENTLLTVHPDGQSDTKTWTGKMSLFDARNGDATGATGRAAGPGASGTLNRVSTFQPGFSSISLGTTVAKQNSSSGQTSEAPPTFTFQTTVIKKASSPVSQ